MIAEKDEILSTALDILLTERIEGAVINEDHLGYWKILEDHILTSSVNSFKSNVEAFFKSLKGNENAKDLLTYHTKFMFRCFNNEHISAASENVYETFKRTLINEYNTELNYDITVNENSGFISFNDTMKIFLMLFLYEDRISIGLMNFITQNTKATNNGKN